MATKTKQSRDDAVTEWTEEELSAIKQRNKELKASPADGEADLKAKIAEMVDADRVIAERIHALVGEVAPSLTARTYYGMPAWAKDGKVLLFFQPAAKFKSRYSTLGFQDTALIDDGAMWPTSWAITTLSKADEARIADLVRRAVG